MDEQIQTLQRLIDESNFTLVITGAGISVASGIPSMHGLNLAETLQFASNTVLKATPEHHAKRRRTWGSLNPVTRSVPSGKTYNRKKEKQMIGKEFRNGFDADLFLQNYIFLLDYDAT